MLRSYLEIGARDVALVCQVTQRGTGPVLHDPFLKAPQTKFIIFSRTMLEIMVKVNDNEE